MKNIISELKRNKNKAVYIMRKLQYMNEKRREYWY